jgi:tetratricopeptide (TPR) repeat protein
LYLVTDLDRFPEAWLRGALEELDWRGHVVVATPGRNDVGPVFERLAAVASCHLRHHRWLGLWLHPVIMVDELGAAEHRWVDRLLDATEPFQREAYHAQSESRLGVLPVLVAATCLRDDALLGLADRFRERLALPTVVLPDSPSETLIGAAVARGLRVVVGNGDPTDPNGVLERLRAHHVVDGALARLDDGSEGPLLGPCPRHLVVDALHVEAFPCLRVFERGDKGVALDRAMTVASQVPPAECRLCTTASALAVRSDMVANRRRSESRELLYRLGLELAEGGDHEAVVEVAAAAFELDHDAPGRAAAAMLRAMSLLALGRLEEADQGLQLAASHGADPGAVAFQRGRVQMAWPDELEALERFEEAERAASPEVSDSELHLQMAICHVRLAEYADARRHLDAVSTAEDHRVVVAFYRGLCELGDGAVERALGQLEQALAAGPTPDDLGRVLLYLATCLKELGRFDEAVGHLERAIDLEPDELAHHNLLGYCLYRLGRHAEAAERFRRAVELDPRSAIDWSNLAANLRRLGRTDEAVAAYTRALELDPGLELAIEGLARTMSDARRAVD